jgi:hypothetical protein
MTTQMDAFPLDKLALPPLGEIVKMPYTKVVLDLMNMYMHNREEPDLSGFDMSVLFEVRRACDQWGVYRVIKHVEAAIRSVDILI